MASRKARTLGELKKQVSRIPDIRQEMRTNLIRKLAEGKPLFPTLIGYDDTVLPALINAVLCGHHIILLGERGQGKSRIIRSMMDLLDEEMVAVAGCPINDDPFAPICTDCRQRLADMGDKLPLEYVPRHRRLVEKLATSDVSTSDLIGDVDPIKIAQGRTLDDETSIHFGLVPRANRGIFAINELPDLAEKIQVAFFNIMEENDLQIKGFPVRLPLDIFMIATANPEDYTSRGRIITPLKDRFDVQIRTHYPRRRADEIAIMDQEAVIPRLDSIEARSPGFMKEIIAEITFQARSSQEINQHSGVSCRISIRGYESILGSAVRRCLELGEATAVPRITDIEAAYPAIVGKLELEFEAEDSKIEDLLDNLTKRAVKVVFDEHFKLDELSSIVEAFQDGMTAKVSRLMASAEYLDGFEVIPGLKKAVQALVQPENPPDAASAIEFILEGLHLSNKLNRQVEFGEVLYK
ncbi:MAG: magnesium chelatase [Deltaproteobacteria bacterium]|nr:magnesium chelatase [Deltaproteobacteria bacterium]